MNTVMNLLDRGCMCRWSGSIVTGIEGGCDWIGFIWLRVRARRWLLDNMNVWVPQWAKNTLTR